MGFWITCLGGLALAAALGVYLRRRGDRAQSWDGRTGDRQAHRSTGNNGGGGGGSGM
jgi:hypothetical protein